MSVTRFARVCTTMSIALVLMVAADVRASA
jgi:hypothetical protein